jgi:S-adenosylmethionine decarboxylase
MPANPNSAGYVRSEPSFNDAEKDFFVCRDGMTFAGSHILIDIWGAGLLSDVRLIDDCLRQGAVDAGATILHGHFHHFTPNGGVSGVLVLAESHISIHTWPERGFAAIDVFMCGICDPRAVIPSIERTFTPQRMVVKDFRRGIV